MKRKAVPQKVKMLLQKEIESSCPFCENADVDHFQIHHIDEDSSNNDKINLIMLCPICHSKITKGDISQPTVELKKREIVNSVASISNLTAENEDQTLFLVNQWYKIISSQTDILYSENPIDGSKMLSEGGGIDFFIKKLMFISSKNEIKKAININTIIDAINESKIIEKYRSSLYYIKCMHEELEFKLKLKNITKSDYNIYKLIYPRVKSEIGEKIIFLQKIKSQQVN